VDRGAARVADAPQNPDAVSRGGFQVLAVCLRVDVPKKVP